jgi:threonine aldolase
MIAEQAAHLCNSEGGGLSVPACVVPRPIKASGNSARYF